MRRRIKDMNWYEQAFIGTGAALLGGAIVAMGYSSSSSSWSELAFVVAFVTCVVLCVQFVLRYIAIATLHGTEVSPSAWIVSLLILVMSLVLVGAIHNPPLWFLALGMLLLLAALKNTQTRRQIDTSVERDNEKLMRLKESMITEASFGLLMILFAALSIWGTHINLVATPASATFYGVIVAAFYTAVSTSVFVFRLLSDEAEFRALLGERE